MTSIEERLDLLKREVDALQIETGLQNVPWYRNVSTIISVAALIFSFGTTVLSYKRSADQDIAASRQELREVLQRLVELPREAAENQRTYRDDPVLNMQMGSFLNQENNFLVAQTGGILDRLPEEVISAGEYYSVALAYFNAYRLNDAESYLAIAHRLSAEAGDFNTEVAALRDRGNLKFILGRPEQGAEHFQAALAIFDKYPGYDPYTKISTHIYTRVTWAVAEANAGNPSVGLHHLAEAERLLSGWPEGPGITSLKAHIAATRTTMLQLLPH